MILYADKGNMSMDANGAPTEMTPAHTYIMTTDFSKILDGLVNGDIPCGSGRPFDVNWNNDNSNHVPWYDGRNTEPFINPWAK